MHAIGAYAFRGVGLPGACPPDTLCCQLLLVHRDGVSLRRGWLGQGARHHPSEAQGLLQHASQRGG